MKHPPWLLLVAVVIVAYFGVAWYKKRQAVAVKPGTGLEGITLGYPT